MIGLLGGWLRRFCEKRADSLFDDAPVAYHEVDRNGVIRRVNRAECVLLGMRREELLGHPVWDLLAPEQREAARAAFPDKFSGRRPLQPFQREYTAAGGRRLMVEIHERLVRDPAGRPVRMRSALFDITARRLTEEALRESEARYRDLFDHIPIGVYRSTPDGRVLMANPALIRMLGYTSFDELRRVNLEKENGPAYDRAGFQKELEARGEIRGRESELLDRRGRRVPVRENAHVVRDPQGGVLYYEGTLEDITERRHAEELHRTSEERYRSLFAEASDIVFTSDLEGHFTSVNKAAERVLGYTQEEFARMGVADLVGPEEGERLHAAIAQRIAGAPPQTREVRVRAKDGRAVLLEVNARLVFENGHPVGIHGIARDTTERKRWEEELERKNRELEAALAAAREATEAKSLFLANMSHEIRTPMNGVVGMTELLLGTPLGPEQREYAEVVRTSADALLLVINDILDFSKIEAGKLELRNEPFSPLRVLEEVCALLRVQALKKRLELRLGIEPGVPPAVHGDAARFRQVLMNLVGNAIKFTASGWIAVRMRAQDAAGAVLLECEVEDTGIGIDPADAPRLFESFVQVDCSTTRKYGGTGLGLPISKRLIELMGGQIGFDSTPGAGSIFRFTLRLESAPECDSPETAGAPPDAAWMPLDSARVLLAEDNEVNCKIALRMLERCGLIADAVSNGRLAVQAAASGAYDVVLMDVHMPEMDGFAATREIRRLEGNARHLWIVAMTARAMIGDREKCLAAGMDDYISKPMRIGELRAALARRLRPAPENPAPRCR